MNKENSWEDDFYCWIDRLALDLGGLTMEEFKIAVFYYPDFEGAQQAILEGRDSAPKP